ncbi:CARDB domain-containing protein [uncultured Lamprocystis sp.]|uniref:CARDB domain-containing protein n=1 Tax=uncultured Lamprocystis sp. TaxID=543132 RepID=UPI0025F232AA|nr:CARDB domain-containing protein [uncultured Lamprocystis sp.]
MDVVRHGHWWRILPTAKSEKNLSHPNLPGFGVTAIDLTPNRPTAGGTFSAAVTVKNRGTAPGDAGTLALWVDQPGVPACGTAGDAAVAVGTLANGASRTLTFDGLPAGAAGAKLLRAFVDYTCVNTEAYDANNQRVKPYTVVP